jgi:hypothetical protein
VGDLYPRKLEIQHVHEAYSTRSRAGVSPDDVVFPNVNTMILWITFWMTRLEILQCFDQLHVVTPESITLSSDMSFLADLICASIPHMTGQTIALYQVGASEAVKHIASLFAMRSLFVAGQVRHSPAVKIRWILQQLEHIGQQKGIGQSLELMQYLQRIQTC